VSSRPILGVNLVLASAGLGWVLWRWGAPAVAVLGRGPSPGGLCLFAAAVVLTLACFTVRWRILLSAMGVAIPIAALAAYRLAGQSVSALVPSAKLGGDPLRAYYLLRRPAPAAESLASVVLDRVLEVGASAIFAVLFAFVLLQRGVPEIRGALVTVSIGLAAMVVGGVVAVRRLRRGASVVASALRAMRLDRLRVVQRNLETIELAEERIAALLEERPIRLAGAFAIGFAASLAVLLEYHLLLRAFGLPASLVAVVAAIFATGAAHSMPVPAGVGVIEGAQMFVFGALGHPPEVGLAVGLVVRLREVCWTVPGLVYLGSDSVRGLGRRAHTAPPRNPV
jgi:uncharacterized protein (TIRG00374 family)